MDLRNLHLGLGDTLASLWAVRPGDRFFTHHWGAARFFHRESHPVDNAPDEAVTIYGLCNEYERTLEAPRLDVIARRAGRVPVQPVLSLEGREALAGFRPERGCVALCPGTLYGQRAWPDAHWLRLAEALCAAGVPVLGLGTQADAPLLRAMGIPCKVGLPMAGWMAEVQAARLVVGVDSAPIHMAAALGVPGVCIHAAVRPLALLGRYPGIVSAFPAGGCAGCHFREGLGFSRRACGQACARLAGVFVEDVLTAVLRGVQTIAKTD